MNILFVMYQGARLSDIRIPALVADEKQAEVMCHIALMLVG